MKVSSVERAIKRVLGAYPEWSHPDQLYNSGRMKRRCFDKTCRIDGLEIDVEGEWGIKEDIRERNDFREPVLLVTQKEQNAYRKKVNDHRASLTDPEEQLANRMSRLVDHLPEFGPRPLEGVIVKSLEDTGLNTINVVRVHVQTYGFNHKNLNKYEWEAFFHAVEAKFGVKYGPALDLIIEDIDHDRFRPHGIPTVQRYRPGQEPMVFKKEAKYTKDLVHTIKSVQQAGQAVQRALLGEQQRLIREYLTPRPA